MVSCVTHVASYLLFSLYGVRRGDVIAGDVTVLPAGDGTSFPPVSFPAEGIGCQSSLFVVVMGGYTSVRIVNDLEAIAFLERQVV